MDSRSLKYVAEAGAGELRAGSPETLVKRACSDSRVAQSGDLFFALKGDRFDGHDFLTEVAARGVAAMVVDKTRVPHDVDCGVLVVDDPQRALGRLAARYRTDFELPVVVVGGSNGKTTTKELVACVLRRKFETVWSEASFNNDIGVPMTLLRLEKKHQVAVLEAGTNHPGELAPLLRMIQPNYGVITSIGREHLEFFGDLAGVAAEEGQLAELLPATGKLFINGDGEWTANIIQRTKAGVARVGLGAGNDWRGSQITMDARGSKFWVNAPSGEFTGEYQINLLGDHQVVNAMFAVAVGAELGLTRAEIQRGLSDCKPAKMRLQLWEWRGVQVLDDAYNANADSMAAALTVLRQMPGAGRKVAVLGDMGELGEHSQAAHEEVGRRAAEAGMDKLFTVGKMAAVMARAARAAGLKDVSEIAEPAAAAEPLRQFLKSGDVMLLKASRSVRLERLAEALKASKAAQKD